MNETLTLEEYVDDRGHPAELAMYAKVVAHAHALEVLHEARERLAARLDGEPGFHHWVIVPTDDEAVVAIRSTLHRAD